MIKEVAQYLHYKLGWARAALARALVP